MKKGSTKYTYEVCFSLAQSCRTRAGFKEKYPYAYVWARKSKWLDDYTWLENGKKKPKRYTLEHCQHVAKSCSSLKEFYTRHYPEWAASKRNGWLDEFKWLERERHSEYTFDECKAEASKYSTKKEFRECASGAYCAARDKGWLDNDFTWLIDETINLEYGRIYVVYCYEFFIGGSHYVYVGLTMRPKERDRRHRENDSAVRNFATCHHIVIPEMRILEDGLTQIEAREKEDAYRRRFLDEGCIVLNRGPTGKNVGSVGGMHRKWTKKKYLEEACRYKTAQDFRDNNMGAYLAGTRHKWNKGITWFEDGYVKAMEKRRKYTYETCIKFAESVQSFKEFRSVYPGAYQVAKKNGWLDKYDWLFEQEGKQKSEIAGSIIELYRRGHTIKKIAELLRKCSLSVRKVLVEKIPTEFRGKYSKAIDEKQILADYKKEWGGTKTEFALAHGLPSLDSLNKLLRKHGLSIQFRKHELAYEECKQVAKLFTTRKDFRAKQISAYRRSREMGWLDTFEWLNKKKNVKWNYARCMKEAQKYKFKTEFKTSAPCAYRVACQNKWLKDFTWFVNGKCKPHKWNKELCYNEARKYSKISDFIHHSLGAYKCAKKYGWLTEYSWFYQRKQCCMPRQLEFTGLLAAIGEGGKAKKRQ